nr:hypothetical protein [Haliangium sp. UPWRP_2]
MSRLDALASQSHFLVLGQAEAWGASVRELHAPRLKRSLYSVARLGLHCSACFQAVKRALGNAGYLREVLLREV